VLCYEGVTLAVKRRDIKSKGKPSEGAERTVRIVEKDPWQLCGKGTSVERVFRVDEKTQKAKIMHLVFFDRHGWYCEHGAQCPAVSDVKKFIRRGR
jgi:hypothetical protein